MNLYLGFADGGNILNDVITSAGQNDLDFALFFNTSQDALKFLNNYFEDKKDVIQEKNKKYYKVEYFNKVEHEPNANIFLYEVPCWFSTEMYGVWRRNPAKYGRKL